MESILLVEDSKFLKIATERVLTKAGYRVICAGDGEEALLLATTSPPGLIMLDMLLPKLSGPEVLRSLKKDVRTAHIPVLVLSSLPQSNERKLLKEGAAAFLEKGTLLDEPSLLLGAVQSALAGNVVARSEAMSRPRFNL
jgi:two-component system phosphate regulon response regulator PhoB